MASRKPRIGSREERSEVLVRLTQHLIGAECKDLGILTEVDKLCRRTWGDIHRGWVSWGFYMERLLGREEYSDWAKANCKLAL